MTRKGFFSTIISALGAVFGISKVRSEGFQSGALRVYANTMERDFPGYRFRVLVDGVDVSNRSYYADEIDGVVDCYCHDKDGRIIFEYPDVKRERLHGNVKIYPYRMIPRNQMMTTRALWNG